MNFNICRPACPLINKCPECSKLIKFCKKASLYDCKILIDQIEKKENEECLSLIGRLLFLFVKFDNLECFRYTLKNEQYSEAILQDSEIFYIQIALHSGLKCLKFFDKMNLNEMPQRVIDYCVHFDNVECFEYCFEQGCEITTQTFGFVINFDAVKCLKFACENGYRIKKDLLFYTKILNKPKCYEYLSTLSFD